jgi:hypothetical protein
MTGFPAKALAIEVNRHYALVTLRAPCESHNGV